MLVKSASRALLPWRMPAKRAPASQSSSPSSEKSPQSGKSSKKVRVLSSRTVYSGKVFSVTSDEIVEPNGVHARRDIVRHQGSVVVLAVDTTQSEPRVLLIRQYRYAPDEF